MKVSQVRGSTGMQLRNKVVLVTGAGAESGRAFATACANAGASIVVADIDSTAAQQVVGEIEKAGGSAVAAAGDVSHRSDAERFVRRAVEVYGQLDVLVNNAGIYVQ